MADLEGNIDKIIDLINQLPPMPDNIVKLRKLCIDPNARFKDFIPLIERDPGLCADILHLANSAYFGVGHRVESVSEAVRYFGMGQLVDFVSISFSEKVIKKYFAGIKDLNDYFKHSRIVSLSTRILSEVAGKNNIEQEFYSVVGLLHDIGRLVLIIVGDEDTTELIGSNWMYIEDQIQKEEELLGVDHTVVGEKICEKWEFSESLQLAIRRHHTPVEKDLCEHAAFIFMGHFISMMDFPMELVHNILPEKFLMQMGLTKAKLTIARELFKNKIEEVGATF